MPEKVMDISDETRQRLYRLAARKHQSPDRVISELINEAALQEIITRAMDRFYARLREVEARGGDGR